MYSDSTIYLTDVEELNDEIYFDLSLSLKTLLHMHDKNTVKYNFLYSILSDICSECNLVRHNIA